MQGKNETDVDLAVFNLECGVGVTVTSDDIKLIIAGFIKENKKDLEDRRYSAVGALLGKLKGAKDLKWANIVAVKQEYDSAILATLGPRDERDDGKKKVLFSSL
jgi:glutaminyl-tRNA synthetase